MRGPLGDGQKLRSRMSKLFRSGTLRRIGLVLMIIMLLLKIAYIAWEFRRANCGLDRSSILDDLLCVKQKFTERLERNTRQK